jgi:integrase
MAKVNDEGMHDVNSFAHLQALLNTWDGKEVPKGEWQAARATMSADVRSIVATRAERFAAAMGSKATAQNEAARHRLIDELGRLLICIEPETDDLNGKFHRLASEQTPTAHRLQNVFQRLGGYPTMEQCCHAFTLMPSATPIERRNKALFAFLMLTGARDGAVASLRLKRIDLAQACVYQDARDVKTKFSKTFTTWFLPVDPVYRETFFEWVNHLRQDLLFGNEDAVFPKLKMGIVDGAFAVTGFEREPYATAGAILTAIKNAFAAAGLPTFGPHSFRHTVVKWGDGQYKSREAFKAFSQNIGHEKELTTVGSYLKVSQERQAELIPGLG